VDEAATRPARAVWLVLVVRLAHQRADPAETAATIRLAAAVAARQIPAFPRA
jgi:hypothetical protein